jgi:hypothetical protein
MTELAKSHCEIGQSSLLRHHRRVHVKVDTHHSQGVGETAQEMVEWVRLTSVQITGTGENPHVSCTPLKAGESAPTLSV